MRAVWLLLFLTGSSAAQNRVAELVLELGNLPPVLAGIARSDGSRDPVEERRKSVYAELRTMGTAALPELSEGLTNGEVRVRRGVALYLSIASGTWGRLADTPLDIREALPVLVAALEDEDGRVRWSAAQTVGHIGPDAVEAVPGLVKMLGMPDEGDRNTACIGLGGIGEAARAALPALREALDDPDKNVRRFAAHAIEKIEGG